MSIIIDKEFQALIPQLSEDEFRQLEENCLKDGIRDALVVWLLPNGGQILLDGHNRYQISRKHDLPYEVKQMKFGLRDDAKAWIIRNQLGRRNIDKWVRFDLVKELEKVEKQKAKERQIRKPADSVVPTLAQQSGKTRDKMADMVGVAHGTYDKMKTIDEYGTPEIKARARSGEISVTEAHRQTTLLMEPPKRSDYAKEAQEEHEAYEEKRKEGIVSIRDASVDKINRRTLALELSKNIAKASNAVLNITILKGDLKNIISELTPEEKQDAQRIIRMTISSLNTLSNQIGG